MSAAGGDGPRVTDLCDAHGDRARVAAPGWTDFGGRTAFSGPVHTLSAFEDNSLVREALEGPGEGRVLVVDGGGSLRCALVGGNLGALAAANGWAGIVVHGCVRDRVELAACPIGIKALGSHPRRSEKRGAGRVGETLRFAGVEIRPGDRLYADEDGWIVADGPLADGPLDAPAA